MIWSKISRYVGTLLFLSAMTCMSGFWWGRTNGRPELAMKFGEGLRYTFYVALTLAAIMGVVGLYHFVMSLIFREDDAPQAEDPESRQPPPRE